MPIVRHILFLFLSYLLPFSLNAQAGMVRNGGAVNQKQQPTNEHPSIVIDFAPAKCSAVALESARIEITGTLGVVSCHVDPIKATMQITHQQNVARGFEGQLKKVIAKHQLEIIQINRKTTHPAFAKKNSNAEVDKAQLNIVKVEDIENKLTWLRSQSNQDITEIQKLEMELQQLRKMDLK